MNAKLLQDTIDFVKDMGCDSGARPGCNGPTMRPTPDTCDRCALLARLLRSQKTYKPRAARVNKFLNLTKE